MGRKPAEDAKMPSLAKPAQRALEAAGIKQLRDLTGWRAADLLALHGLGPSALERLRVALEARGLAFKPPC